MGPVALLVPLLAQQAAAEAAAGRPPPPPPPNPCGSGVTDAPQWHISNMGAGPHDANALFEYKGVWHAMHQANWTDWAHLVSTGPPLSTP